MNNMHAQSKKPRKILGTGSVKNIFNCSSNSNNRYLNSSPLQHHSLNGRYITSSPTPLALEQQQQLLHHQNNCRQQMERLRIAGIMNQEAYPLWPYGTTAYMSQRLPSPNMALQYLPNALPYHATVPIYRSGSQQYTLSPVPSNPNILSAGNHQIQHHQQSINVRLNIPNNSNPITNTNNGSITTKTNFATANKQSNESHNLKKQIGLQYVSQYTRVNCNSMIDTIRKINPPCGANQTMPSSTDKESKESSSSVKKSPNPSNVNGNINANNNGATGDFSKNNLTNAFIDDNSNNKSDAAVTLSQSKFNEFTRLALRGSEIAEKLAYSHRNRPCFKKIDSLCARMKQDLIRPDGVLPNINSQGIAWAVKDFIFVFTRIINAWIIMKGYVYNTPEGLNKVKAALTPDFQASFASWQNTTLDFTENLIKSFVNLDNLVQTTKSSYQKTENGEAIQNTNTPIKLLESVNGLLYDETFDFLNNTVEDKQQNSINKNYKYTMVEDSEGSQRLATLNGTYFKTGTYNPIKKDTLLNQSPVNNVGKPNNYTNNSNNSLTKQPNLNVVPITAVVSTASSPGHILTRNSPLVQYNDQPFSEIWPNADISTTPTEALKIKPKLPPPSQLQPISAATPANWLKYDNAVLQKNLNAFAAITTTAPTATNISRDGAESLTLNNCINNNNNYTKNNNASALPTIPETAKAPITPKTLLAKDVTHKFNVMVERLLSMKTADVFFKSQFTKNYFPDFIADNKTDFMDIRSIILKCQIGGYHNIDEVVHDIRKIVFMGKEFLKIHNNAKLQGCLNAFEAELNKFLSEPPFDNDHFEHITGESKKSIGH